MANGHGGKRQGAGRKPGSASQKTREIANQAATDGLTPLEYMLAVLRDDTADPDRRDRMAVAAAPYIHARLAAIETKVETVGQIEAKITFEERRRQAVEAVRAAFAERRARSRMWPRRRRKSSSGVTCRTQRRRQNRRQRNPSALK